MPAFNQSIPQLPLGFDYRDVVDHVDRLLEVANQACVQLQGQMFPLTINATDGNAWTTGNFPYPAYVVSGSHQTTYEKLLTNATYTGYGTPATDPLFGTNGTGQAGIVELASALSARFAAIQAYNPNYKVPAY